MPHVYIKASQLEGEPLAGDGDCVALVKKYAPGLQGIPTSAWRAGKRVMDAANLAPGTAIATFVAGKYPNRPSGNHAAFFLRRSGAAIWVVDQWKNDPVNRPYIRARLIHGPKPRVRPNADGSWPDASNVSEAYYVIE